MNAVAPPNRRLLYLLIAVFFVPILASFVMYYGMDWRPATQTNHGELYQPARPLPQAAIVLRDKWTLVYVGDGACDAACRTALVYARQTRLSLNQEMTRVDRVLLATSHCCDRAYLDAEQAGLTLVDGAAPALRDFVAAFPAADRAVSLFVVDPNGNLVMRHDVRKDPKGLLTDLKKLLKLSHIG